MVPGAHLRIFKTKVERIGDRDLRDAVERVGRGLIDADLGRRRHQAAGREGGHGRCGGFRVLLAFRSQDRAVFIHGFAKSERDNIDGKELKTIREIAAASLSTSTAQFETEIASGGLQEVPIDN